MMLYNLFCHSPPYFLQSIAMNKKLPISANLIGRRVLGSICFPTLVLLVHAAMPGFSIGTEDLNSSPLAFTTKVITH